MEAWCHLDRGRVFQVFGRENLAQTNFNRARELAAELQNEELDQALAAIQ